MKNLLKQKLDNKETVIGTLMAVGNPAIMELLGYAGIDFVMLDTEQRPHTADELANIVRAAELANITTIVRVAEPTHKEIQSIAWSGAKGVVIPCLKYVDQVKKLVDIAKYPPLGNRGFAKGRDCGYGNEAWSKKHKDYMDTSNEEFMVIPQCETAECLDAIEEVAALAGVDGILIGPNDLSISMGIPGEFAHPDFVKALDRIKNACKKAGKPAFIFCGNVAKGKGYIEAGYEGVLYSRDSKILVDAYKEIVEGLRG